MYVYPLIRFLSLCTACTLTVNVIRVEGMIFPISSSEKSPRDYSISIQWRIPDNFVTAQSITINKPLNISIQMWFSVAIEMRLLGNNTNYKSVARRLTMYNLHPFCQGLFTTSLFSPFKQTSERSEMDVKSSSQLFNRRRLNKISFNFFFNTIY